MFDWDSVFNTNSPTQNRNLILMRLSLLNFSNLVFIKDVLDFKDICQNNIGTCWFFSLIAILLKKEFLCLIEALNILENTTNLLNKNISTFKFNLYKHKRLEKIIIDNFFLFRKHPDEQPIFEYSYNKNQPEEIWIPCLEKAVAKLYDNSYKNIDTGYIENAFEILTGSKGDFFMYESVDNFKHHVLLNKNLKNFCDQNILVCFIDQINHSNFDKYNVESKHAYAILNIFDYNKTGRFEDFVFECYNPWGYCEPTKHSMIDSINDGHFLLKANDFIKMFTRVMVIDIRSQLMKEKNNYRQFYKSCFSIMDGNRLINSNNKFFSIDLADHINLIRSNNKSTHCIDLKLIIDDIYLTKIKSNNNYVGILLLIKFSPDNIGEHDSLLVERFGLNIKKRVEKEYESKFNKFKFFSCNIIDFIKNVQSLNLFTVSEKYFIDIKLDIFFLQ